MPMQTVNTMMYLESPYPDTGKVEVINMTAQLVTADGSPVPLSDVRNPPPGPICPGPMYPMLQHTC